VRGAVKSSPKVSEFEGERATLHRWGVSVSLGIAG